MQWNCLATFNASLLLSLSNQLTHWLNDWLTDWLTEWVNVWMCDCLTEIGKRLLQRWQLCTPSLSSTHTSFVCVASVVVVVVFGDFHLSAKRKWKRNSLLSLWLLLPPAAPLPSVIQEAACPKLSVTNLAKQQQWQQQWQLQWRH